MPTAKLRGRYGRLSLQTISPEKRRWAEQPSRSRMFRQTPTGPGNSSAGMDRARQVANVAVPMDHARTKWLIFLPIVVLRPTPLRKGVAFWPPSPHFVLTYLLPALFADACTLAGGAYFLQSGFEQRSCSTHEQATRLSPFQKSQGVSSVHPQPRQARSLLIRSS